MNIVKEKMMIHNNRAVQKTHDRPPNIINNVTVTLSKNPIYQGDAIDISFTTTTGEFPSNETFLIITYDDVDFNTSYTQDWSSPNHVFRMLEHLQKYNPITEEYEALYNSKTGVISGLVLPFYPQNFKAVLYQGLYSEATNILGVSQTFEIIKNKMSIVATQNKRQVKFDIEASAPIWGSRCWFVIILAKDIVPDTMDWTTYYSWHIYNSTILDYVLQGEYDADATKGTAVGWDKDWPKGEYKLVMSVFHWMYSSDVYHLAVSNTIAVQKPWCRMDKQTCKKQTAVEIMVYVRKSRNVGF
jgi:hypothetical protein